MTETKVTETTIQAVLMNWVMNERHHIYTVPNSTVIFRWESDLISVTKALLTHEYEIKISMADYRKDAKKKYKHMALKDGINSTTPNYFWYVTYDFDIDAPEYAGWIKITKNPHWYYDLRVKKDAPRLTDKKLSNDKQLDIARLLSYRLTNVYKGYLATRKESQP